MRHWNEFIEHISVWNGEDTHHSTQLIMRLNLAVWVKIKYANNHNIYINQRVRAEMNQTLPTAMLRFIFINSYNSEMIIYKNELYMIHLNVTLETTICLGCR